MLGDTRNVRAFMLVDSNMTEMTSGLRKKLNLRITETIPRNKTLRELVRFFKSL